MKKFWFFLNRPKTNWSSAFEVRVARYQPQPRASTACSASNQLRPWDTRTASYWWPLTGHGTTVADTGEIGIGKSASRTALAPRRWWRISFPDSGLAIAVYYS